MSDFWAGYISGALGILIGNPLDVIKVRVQASQFHVATSLSAAGTSPLSSVPVRPTSLNDSLRGLPAPVLGYGAINAILFTTYTRSLALLPSITSTNDLQPQPQPDSRHHPYWTHFLAGALAGLATFIISAPTDLIKCRAQIASDHGSLTHPQTQPPSSSWAILKSTLRHEGLRGLYFGGVITSVRDAVGYGFYFWTYEVSKDLWERGLAGARPAGGLDAMGGPGIGHVGAESGVGGQPAGKSATHEAVKILLCGGVAGVATWASIFPLDVVKTRVQTQLYAFPDRPAVVAAGRASVGHGVEGDALLARTAVARVRQPLRKGAVQMAREAYRREGAGVFFRGITVCCVRAFIVNAVQWAAYEYIMHLEF